MPIFQKKGQFPRGCTIANNSTDADHDIDIAAGWRYHVSNDAVLSFSAQTKQLNASYADGDDAGGLFDGSIAADTTYHVFLITKDSDGSVQCGFDTSETAANIPSGYSNPVMIGSVVTDSSSNILAFTQDGDYFEWAVGVLDVNVGNPGTSGDLRALTVPTGIKVMAEVVFRYSNNDATQGFALLTSPQQTDTTPSASHFHVTSSSSFVQAEIGCKRTTNTSGQIRTRSSFSSANTAFNIRTRGFHHPACKGVYYGV